MALAASCPFIQSAGAADSLTGGDADRVTLAITCRLLDIIFLFGIIWHDIMDGAAASGYAR